MALDPQAPLRYALRRSAAEPRDSMLARERIVRAYEFDSTGPQWG
jgi:hypothetical protein